MEESELEAQIRLESLRSDDPIDELDQAMVSPAHKRAELLKMIEEGDNSKNEEKIKGTNS